MANTFDTSRVGGGTYELAQDANGNYNLNSVGFTQVNKLNLPDLKTSDTSVADTTKKATEDTIKAQTTEVFKPTNVYQGGGGSQPDTSTPMLKTADVNKPTVRSAGDNSTYNQMSDTEKNAIATGTSGKTFTGATGTEKYNTPRTIADQKQYLGQTFTKPQTGLQKVQSAVQNTVSGVVDSVKNNKALQMAGTILGVPLSPLMTGAKMVAGMLPKETSTQKMNKGYFNTNEGSQRISGNPATDLYAGMNRTSDFGNLENAGNKRIATREATITRREKSGKPMSDKFKSDTANMKTQAASYKQAKETATDTSPGATGGEGGSSGSDSGRVICTDLHRTGELSTRDWIRDTKFTFKTLSITHVKGYLLWAEPTVKHIQKYPRYRKVWKHIAQHRANDIAWRLNEGKFDLLGRIYAGIGEPLCWALGNFVSNKQINKYNLTHWRRA
jgi:hypothetical protein